MKKLKNGVKYLSGVTNTSFYREVSKVRRANLLLVSVIILNISINTGAALIDWNASCANDRKSSLQYVAGCSLMGFPFRGEVFFSLPRSLREACAQIPVQNTKGA